MYDGKFGLYPDSKNESLKSSVLAIRKIRLEIVCRVHGRDPRLGTRRPVRRLEQYSRQDSVGPAPRQQELSLRVVHRFKRFPYAP